MAALPGDPFQRWEEETRQASIRGLEGLLCPPGEWPSFLVFSAGPEPESTLPWEVGGGVIPLAESNASSPPGPSPAEAPLPPAGETPPPLPQEATQIPEAKRPEDLRTEIEDFLGQDRPAALTEEEVQAYVKGGFDPNLEPED